MCENFGASSNNATTTQKIEKYIAYSNTHYLSVRVCKGVHVCVCEKNSKLHSSFLIYCDDIEMNTVNWQPASASVCTV